jgi:hypothetical protein
MGNIVGKCWMQQYESAVEVRCDVESFLEGKGYEVEGDGIKDFDLSSAPGFAMNGSTNHQDE